MKQQSTAVSLSRFAGCSRFLILAVISLCLPIAAFAEPSRHPKHERWELIAQSDLIARARLRVPLNALKENLRTGEHDYIDLQAELLESIKGQFPQRSIRVRYFTEPGDHSPSVKSLEEADGQEVLVFLLLSDDRGAAGWYFAGYTPDAIAPIYAGELSAIAAEVENQEELARCFDTLPAGQPAPSDARIADLLEKLTSADTQPAAWDQLLKLSPRHAAALVRLLNDRRPTADVDFLVPSPDHLLHYGPQQIVDAASVVLTGMAHTSFRFLYNGGSDRERAANVNAWRVWSIYIAP